MSFLAGSVSTLGILVVLLLGYVAWVSPKARTGIYFLVVLATTHVLAFTVGTWWGCR